MTKQIKDTFLFQGNSYALFNKTEGELIYPFRQFGMMPEMISTACYHGFYATYELTENALMLKEFTLREKHDKYLPINGVIGGRDDLNGAYVYKNLNFIVPFTGKIQLAKDTDGEIRKRYCELRCDFKEFLVIILRDGHVVNISNRSEDME